MRQRKLLRPFIIMSASFVLLTVFAPGELAAITRVVDPNNPAGCVTSSDPPCYTTIGAAITAADTVTGDDVFVEPGTYTENLSLNKNISIQGRETARTIISGGGSGTLLTVNGVNSITIYNFTFIDAAVGILVSNSTNVNINNNVFNLGSGRTAVENREIPSSTEIINNTFYTNGTAVLSDSNITVKNNIFDNNTNVFLPVSRDVSFITFNLFNGNGDNGPSDADLQNANNIITGDPSFVDITARDFHVDKLSDTIAAGAGSEDIGAYGGSLADTIPFPVSELKIDTIAEILPETDPKTYNVAISWLSNESYLITEVNPNTSQTGGYWVYYNINQSGPTYQSDSDVGLTTIATLTGLSEASPPAAPDLSLQTEFTETTITVFWDTVLGATGYTVYWRNITNPPLPPAPAEESADAMNETSYTIMDLKTGDDYEIEVSAYAQNTYYIAVTAYDSTLQTLVPGVQHESDYSNELVLDIGSRVEGLRSANTVTEFPERIGPLPDLPNEGCFIATAAYGYYSAPNVQVLRDFRDHYLLANAPGRAFVKWYYTYGPIAARFINEHPWLKPVVRAGLLPVVGTATLMTRTSVAAKMAIIIFTMLMLSLIVQRKLHRKLSQHEAIKAEQR